MVLFKVLPCEVELCYCHDKYFFCNRICDTWNALPHTVVEAPSLNTFKRLLNNVSVCHVAVLP